MSDVLGLGVDIVDVQRMAGIVRGKAGKSFLGKTFAKKEIAYAKGNAEKLAAIFAAKEATFKAFGTGWVDGKCVEVVHVKNGKPGLLLHGKMEKFAKKRRVGSMLVSISHTECYAIAAVVISSP
jgi:holo-[acyl-carrier protein] synthase